MAAGSWLTANRHRQRETSLKTPRNINNWPKQANNWTFTRNTLNQATSIKNYEKILKKLTKSQEIHQNIQKYDNNGRFVGIALAIVFPGTQMTECYTPRSQLLTP